MKENQTPNKELVYWRLSSVIEAGRAEVLKMVAQQESLDKVLTTLCQNSEVYNPQMKTSVLRLNQEEGTLHPCASVSLPEFYCDALEGVQIGVGVGSCGTAAFRKERVIVEDINTHPYWTHYKDLAISAGLQSCWSEPILGANGKCFGTFAIYYDHPKTPEQEDLKFIEACANLAAVVFENNLARNRLLEANSQLNQTINERNKQLLEANEKLSLVIEQQKRDQLADLNREKSETTRKLLAGFAHEINTPLGIALTCESHAKQLIEELQQGIESNSLKKSLVSEKLEQTKQGLDISLNNLYKTVALISRFKEIDVGESEINLATFSLKSFFKEVGQSSKLKGVQFDYEMVKDEKVQDVILPAKYSFWQAIDALIDNSLEHGFMQPAGGVIQVYVSVTQEGLELSYQDNGCGLKEGTGLEIFEPFYSTSRSTGKVGLGLSVVRNIITSVYNGTIEIVPSPVGIKFRIVIPKSEFEVKP